MENKLQVGIIGSFQIGKSTFVNCLLDDKVAKTGGMGVSVTSISTRYVFGPIQGVKYMSNGRAVKTCRLHEFLQDENIASGVDEVVVSLWKPILKDIDIVDTPGFNANDKDTKTTNKAIEKLDFIIVLLNNRALNTLEEVMIDHLRIIGKPFIVIVNCINNGGAMWDPNSKVNEPILTQITNRIEAIGASPLKINKNSIHSCNLIWHWYASEHYLNDEPMFVTQIESQINFFEKVLLKSQDIDCDKLAKNSNFSQIRDLFANDTTYGFPYNYIRWNSKLMSKLSDWENNIIKKLNQI
ncbi:MAG: dynamin family protein [bacterium]